MNGEAQEIASLLVAIKALEAALESLSLGEIDEARRYMGISEEFKKRAMKPSPQQILAAHHAWTITYDLSQAFKETPGGRDYGNQ